MIKLNTAANQNGTSGVAKSRAEIDFDARSTGFTVVDIFKRKNVNEMSDVADLTVAGRRN